MRCDSLTDGECVHLVWTDNLEIKKVLTKVNFQMECSKSEKETTAKRDKDAQTVFVILEG